MYVIEKHVNLNPAKDYWLPMAFQDAALLHAFIFCADEHEAIARGRKESPAAIVHLRKAIEIVNERLRAEVPIITDATIAVICTFAHTEVRCLSAPENPAVGPFKLDSMFPIHLAYPLVLGNERQP
jgi:hypothetical protein